MSGLDESFPSLGPLSDHAPDAQAAELHELLAALQAVRDGDFSVRLPGHWVGLEGKIADTFNQIVASNAKMASELERVVTTVGKQGKLLRAKVRVFAELHRKTRQLEALNKALEARVAERTAALESTTQALRDANHRKDEFLAMLAHELRNPLAPIRTAAHLLRNPRLPETQRESAGAVIERQVDHLVRLVDDLLDVSRVSRGVIALDLGDVEVAEVVTAALEATRPIIVGGGLEVTVDLPPEALQVHADSTRLVQALGNVLHNAAKFTPRGGRIEIAARREGPEAVVSVRDTGIGIREDMLDKVFDLFVQADPGRGRGGLGLGLSLVRRIVEMHGGRVQVTSQGPDRGTEVTLRLPVSERQATRHQSAARAHVLAPSGPRRVLVVDDNRDAAETLALMLELAGHRTRLAYDGLEALSVGESFNPEVVLLDLGMPNLDGYEVVRRIRAQRWGRHALIVALTGWGQQSDRQRTAEAGFDHHLVKPVGEAELADALSARGPPAGPAERRGPPSVRQREG